MSESSFYPRLAEELIDSVDVRTTVDGRRKEGVLYLTSGELALRLDGGEQDWTVDLAQIGEITITTPRWLGIIRRGTVSLDIEIPLHAPGRRLHRLIVDDPESWMRKIIFQIENRPAPISAKRRLSLSLADGTVPQAQYTSTLLELAFPAGKWHPEDLETLQPTIKKSLKRVGAWQDLPKGFWKTIVADMEGALFDNPGNPKAARIRQISLVVDAVNRSLHTNSTQRFHAFETFPTWPEGEPVWLFLTGKQAHELVRRDILIPIRRR